tara:strand:+ start:1565 stop:2101 length:537 start_codon:yes stop_codon:yes gene_type:complete
MTFVVTENCINCKFQDCVTVCPVDCFYEGENFLVIHPDECIDCGVCEPECPADAIKPDTEPGLDKWLAINTKYAEIWPNIAEIGVVPPDAEKWNGKPDKARLLIAGDEPEGHSTQKPVYAVESISDEQVLNSFEIEGTKVAFPDPGADTEVATLPPREPEPAEGFEIDGLRVSTGPDT